MSAAKKKRKSKLEQQIAHEERVVAHWPQFRDRLARAQTLADALAIVGDAVPPDTPGRTFYSNLGVFLQSFAAPDGSSEEERVLYLEFVRRLDEAGVLKSGEMARIERDLSAPIAVR